MHNIDINKNFPRPTWQPGPSPSPEWTITHLTKYLGGRSFTLYSHGTCVIWIGKERLEINEAHRRLQITALQHPDFKVQRHADGNYLVSFKGGIGGLMSGDILMANLTNLRREALAMGLLPHEKFLIDRHDADEELDLIAGLYVRARMYQDIDTLIATMIVSP